MGEDAFHKKHFGAVEEDRLTGALGMSEMRDFVVLFEVANVDRSVAAERGRPV